MVTDHLFNDMPLAIKDAFRTRQARADRDDPIASYPLGEWTMDRADEILGPVPAAIMRNAAAGRIAALSISTASTSTPTSPSGRSSSWAPRTR